MIVLNSTVLAYAVGEDHPLRDPCRRLLAAHADGRVDATTTVEVVQELVHVRARRRERADAVALGRQVAQAFTLIVTSADDLERGLALFERQPALGAFDAVLAAVAIEQGADALVSADRAFAGIPGLRWVDPGSAALDRLIGG